MNLTWKESPFITAKNADDKMEAFPSFEANLSTPVVATVIYKCHSESTGLELLVATIRNPYFGYRTVRYSSYIFEIIKKNEIGL